MTAKYATLAELAAAQAALREFAEDVVRRQELVAAVEALVRIRFPEVDPTGLFLDREAVLRLLQPPATTGSEPT